MGKVVIASVDYRPGHAEIHSPDDPEVSERMPTESDFREMRDEYAQVAPDPDHFDEVAAKTSAMVQAAEDWTDDELGSIQAPTLPILGDTDFVPLRRRRNVRTDSQRSTGSSSRYIRLTLASQGARSRCRSSSCRSSTTNGCDDQLFPDPKVGWVCPSQESAESGGEA